MGGNNHPQMLGLFLGLPDYFNVNNGWLRRPFSAPMSCSLRGSFSSSASVVCSAWRAVRIEQRHQLPSWIYVFSSSANVGFVCFLPCLSPGLNTKINGKWFWHAYSSWFLHVDHQQNQHLCSTTGFNRPYSRIQPQVFQAKSQSQSSIQWDFPMCA